MKKICGIYKIIDENGRFYIGSSKDCNRRFSQHQRHLIRKAHPNVKMSNYFNKHGKMFSFEVLIECDYSVILETEQKFIDDLNPHYNVNRSADRPPGFNRKHTEEEKARMSAGYRYRKMSPSHSEALFASGKKGLEKYRAENKEAFIDLVRNNIRKAIEFNKGKPRSESTKEKLRKSHTGMKRSESHKEKIRIHLQSEEFRSKLCQPRSEDCKQRMRDAWAIKKANGYVSPKKAPVSQDTRDKMRASRMAWLSANDGIRAPKTVKS